MNNIDKGLIKMFWRGWDDSGEDNPRFEHFTGKELKAYQIGWYDYLAGDDVSSVDEKTDEEVLAQIHKKASGLI